MRLVKALAIAACAVAPFVVLDASDAAPSSTWARGIDVSTFQGTIDWDRVAASGVSFAICRVSAGTHAVDSQFARNWKEAKRVGLVRGVYQFFRPSQSATAQADLLLSRVKFEPGDLPPVLDVEKTDGLGSREISAGIKTWCDRIKQKTGLTPMIYTSASFWNPLTTRPDVSATPLWVAHWNVSAPRIPAGWRDWTFWQTSDKGRIPGITGPVDLDYFHGTVAQLRELAKKHGPQGSTTTPPPPPPAKPILRQGDQGAAVKELQQKLDARGFDPGPIDGIFGPRTKAALVGFQRSEGLAPDGIAGPLTWKALT